MSVEIQYEPNNICLLRISGVLKRAEFGSRQSAIGQNIDAGAHRACSPFSKTSRAGNAARIGTIWILFSAWTGVQNRDRRRTRAGMEALAFAGLVRRLPVKSSRPTSSPRRGPGLSHSRKLWEQEFDWEIRGKTDATLTSVTHGETL